MGKNATTTGGLSLTIILCGVREYERCLGYRPGGVYALQIVQLLGLLASWQLLSVFCVGNLERTAQG